MTQRPPLTTIPPEPERDSFGRPYIVPPNGGQAVPYTRCTTFVNCVEDRTNLEKWKMRMVALGLHDRQDLVLSVAAYRNDRNRLNAICEEALDAAQGKAGATMGTAYHELTEQLDRGLEPQVPAEYQADMAAYAEATRELSALYIEQMTVQDPLKVAGTPDRIVKYQGKRYIADLKTGEIDYGGVTIAGQLAMYARSRPYDVATGERLEPHGADVERGIVIHLPAKENRERKLAGAKPICTLHWVDLLAGWEVVRVCKEVRTTRRLSSKVLKELHPLPPAPLTLPEQIRASATPDAVRALWSAHAAEWTDELTELAKQHIAALTPA